MPLRTNHYLGDGFDRRFARSVARSVGRPGRLFQPAGNLHPVAVSRPEFLPWIQVPSFLFSPPPLWMRSAMSRG